MKWNEIQVDDIVEVTDIRQGIAAMILVSALEMSNGALSINSHGFLKLTLREPDLDYISFENQPKASLPANHRSLELADYGDIKPGTQAYFITDDNFWAYTNNFRLSYHKDKQGPFLFDKKYKNNILIYR